LFAFFMIFVSLAIFVDLDLIREVWA